MIIPIWQLIVSIVATMMGSAVIVEIIRHWSTKKQLTAGTVKLRNEAGEIVIEGEIKISEFYKKEFVDMRERYENLKKMLNEEKLKNDAAISDLRAAEIVHNEYRMMMEKKYDNLEVRCNEQLKQLNILKSRNY